MLFQPTLDAGSDVPYSSSMLPRADARIGNAVIGCILVSAIVFVYGSAQALLHSHGHNRHDHRIPSLLATHYLGIIENEKHQDPETDDDLEHDRKDCALCMIAGLMPLEYISDPLTGRSARIIEFIRDSADPLYRLVTSYAAAIRGPPHATRHILSI